MSAESDLDWINRCRGVEESWRGRARKVLSLYRDENRPDTDQNVRYNVLWANTEAMKPALYSATPEPVVSRRYKDEDPLGKEVSKVIERALEYFEDCEDFDVQAKRCRDDVLLPGRGVIKVHYVPTMAYGDAPRIQVSPVYNEEGGVKAYSDGESEHLFAEQDENGYYIEGEAEQEVVDETVTFERVPWDLFVIDNERCWGDCTKIAFGCFMDLPDLKRYFGRKANKVQLNYDSADVDQRQAGQSKKAYALVWEIWDKRKKEVRWVCSGYEGYLEKEKDPLKLQHFFPTPEPIYAVKTNDSLVPIPLYTMYQDQARELDITTARIYKIIDAMRVRGLYAGSDEAILKQVFASDDLELIPVSSFANLSGSDFSKMIMWLPIEQLHKAAIALHQHRMTLIESIYEITGMADILRGATDPRETKGAQVLKSQYASRRLVDHKQNLERYFRDLLRIAAEIVCEKFSAETLTRITGMQCTPEMKQLMEDDLLRSYRIDIETDSTVAPDEQRDKEQAVEAITAMGNFASLVAPLVQQGQMSKEAASGMAQWFVRKFRMGRDLEDFMQQMEKQPPQPPPPDPEQQAKAQAIMQKAQIDQQAAQMKAQLEMQKFELEKQKMAFELEIEKAKLQQELEIERMKAEQEMRLAEKEAAAATQRKDQESSAKSIAMMESSKKEEGHSKEMSTAMKGLTEAVLNSQKKRKIIRGGDGEIASIE
jgi:hypothetical protein